MSPPTPSALPPGAAESAVPGIAWPGLPAPADAAVLGLAYQLNHIQWWPPAVLEGHQLKQAELLLDHAWRTVPAQRERLQDRVGLPPGSLTMATFRDIPVLTGPTWTTAGDAFDSSVPPADHGTVRSLPVVSAGQPNIKVTGLRRLFSRALMLRWHLWHDRELTAAAARIGPADVEPEGRWAYGYPSGALRSLEAARPPAEQLAWLAESGARYLLTTPSRLRRLMAEAPSPSRRPPNLNEVMTHGESTDAEGQRLCQEHWQLPVTHSYATREAGLIAVQAPGADHYLVQAESVLLEVLDDRGRPCGPGETGRVVLTDLHNFATPVIRCDLGDRAEVGLPDPTGRSLPTLTRIVRPSFGSR